MEEKRFGTTSKVPENYKTQKKTESGEEEEGIPKTFLQG